MIITIDGPAGSGKGTLAKKLAEVLDFYHLDTGLLYRGVAFVAQQMGTDITNEDDLVEIASNLQLTQLNKLVLSNENIGRAASDMARLARVRIALLAKQRKVAHHPPLSKLGAVLDGRDTGTIVCPDANIKFFLTASLAERANRRLAELRAVGSEIDFDTVYAMLAARDEQDANRVVAPMKKAADAIEIDTTTMDSDELLHVTHNIVKDYCKSNNIIKTVVEA